MLADLVTATPELILSSRLASEPRLWRQDPSSVVGAFVSADLTDRSGI
jgi:hypothetical protein